MSPPTPTPSVPSLTGTQAPTTPISVESVWTFNGGSDPFRNPIDIAIDAAGNLYIADQGQSFENVRVVKIDPNGQFLTQWSGEGQGKLSSPSGVAVDGQGNVYVTDEDGRVLKFDGNGKFLTQWGSPGTGDGQFSYPADIVVDGHGQVFVLDGGKTPRIQKFDSDGKFLTSWGNILGEQDEHGKISSFAVDQQGNIYVGVYSRNGRLIKFDNNGQLLVEWKQNEGQLSCPLSGASDFIGYLAGVWLDPQGHLYVADNDYARICVFDENGIFVGGWGEQGDQAGQLNRPADVVGDGAGHIYVLENSTGNTRVQKFRIK